MLIFAESDGAASVSAPSGYQHAPGSPVSNGGTNLSIFWKRLTSVAGEEYPTLSASNHRIFNVWLARNCIESGSPFDLGQSAGTGSGLGVSLTGGTTNYPNELFIGAVATSNRGLGGNQFRQFNAWVNSSVSNLGRGTDQGTTAGNDGAVGFCYGHKETAGAIGTTTTDLLVSSDWAGWIGTLRPKN